jgi:hypothetical protein
MIMKIRALGVSLICGTLLASVSPVLADGLTINLVSRTDTASTTDSSNVTESNSNSNSGAEPWNDTQMAGTVGLDSATAMQNSDVSNTPSALTLSAAISTKADASENGAKGNAVYDIGFFLDVAYNYSFSASADGNLTKMIFTFSSNDPGGVDIFDSFTESGSGVLAPGNYEVDLESNAIAQVTDASPGAKSDFNDLNFSMTLTPASAPEPATNVILASICGGVGLALSWLRWTKSGQPASPI